MYPPPPPSPDGDAPCSDLFFPWADNREAVSFDTLADLKVSKIRWVQQPTEAEIKGQREMFIDQLRPFDRDGDGQLSLREAKEYCGSDRPLVNGTAGYRK
jgi:hypothetical protein